MRVIRSHLGHVLLAMSWSYILFVWMYPVPHHPHLVGCVPTRDEIYTITEVLRTYPIWIVVIAVAHVPANILTAGVTKLFQLIFSLSCTPTARVEVLMLFLFSAVQWLLLGYIIESLFRRWRFRT
jgi:hypothetical protein